MPEILGPEDGELVIRFGGGLHTRSPADEIPERGCVDGRNFDLDLKNTTFRPRQPYDVVGLAPNNGSIRGMASLLRRDGTASMLVQAGDTVYEWDGTIGGMVDTGLSVDATSKLRGHTWHNWQLGIGGSEAVIITDLALVETVKYWNGTTFADISFTDEDGVAFGDFKAKYCNTTNERATFANVKDSAGASLPHMVVGTKVGDPTQITVANKPSSALAEDDPFYLLTPDLRYINGYLSAFDILIISTIEGKIFKLAGTSAKDFAMYGLYPKSGASGDEAMTYVGNDVFYGRQGRVESLKSTDRFGNVEGDDISLDIFTTIQDYENWTLAYNHRTQRVYCYPQDNGEMWVCYKPLVGGDVSPWMRYKTNHYMGFNPTCMMSCYDPIDALEYIFMGGSDGVLYRMEGTLNAGDGGRETFGAPKGNTIKTERLSKLYALPKDTEAFNVSGWVKYIAKDEVTLELRFEWQGDQIFTETIRETLSGASGGSYYGGGAYYGGGTYYGTDKAKFRREKFGVPGKSTDFQVRAIVESTQDFEIGEIGLRFEVVT